MSKFVLIYSVLFGRYKRLHNSKVSTFYDQSPAKLCFYVIVLIDTSYDELRRCIDPGIVKFLLIQMHDETKRGLARKTAIFYTQLHRTVLLFYPGVYSQC